MASITMKELLEAGVHFGHQTKRWNPRMKEFIFGERNGIYIVDLQKTLRLFKEALGFAARLGAEGKTVLFVGTKRQAQEVVAEEAVRSGMFFVNQRWLGGTLTNFVTIKKRTAETTRSSSSGRSPMRRSSPRAMSLAGSFALTSLIRSAIYGMQRLSAAPATPMWFAMRATIRM